VQIVDEHHQRTVVGHLPQGPSDLAENGGEVELRVGECGRKEVRQRAQRYLAGTVCRRCPCHCATAVSGDREALVGQAGLAYSSGADDDQAVGTGIVERRRELIDLGLSANQRPLKR
jgi:hypothetical protein